MKRITLLLLLTASTAFAQCKAWYDPLLGELTCPPTGGSGSGTVTSVNASFTGGLISVSGGPIINNGTLAFTVAGTAGGIPYFPTSSTWASSAALGAGALVTGGGRGAPSTPSATTTLDSSGNLSTPGTVSSGAGGTNAGGATFLQGTALGITTNAVTRTAPTSVTGYNILEPAAAGTGIPHYANSANIVTTTISAVSLTADISGVLPLANGGTNGTDAASNGGIVWSNATQYKILAGTATAGLGLFSGASGTPAWSAGPPAQKFFGTAAPGSVTGNLPGDLFSDTTNHNDYWCNATSGTAAPACTSVTTGGWTLLNGGGGGSTPTYGQLLSGDSTVTGMPITDFIMWEEFPTSNTVSTTIGSHGWATNCSGAAGGLANVPVSHPGIYSLLTGSSANNSCQIALGSFSGWNLLPSLAGQAGWEMVFIVNPVTSVDTATTVIRVGTYDLNLGVSDLTQDSNLVELAAGNATPGNFFLKSCDNGGTCASVDTTVAPTANHWYKIRMFSASTGQMQCQISTDGAAYSTATSAITMKTGLPDGNTQSPAFYVKELGGSVTRGLYADYWGIRWASQTR